MNELVLQWDEAKAASNYAKHGISFEYAAAALLDPFAVELVDDRKDYGEPRYVLTGLAHEELVTLIYTERGAHIRIISARRANKYERHDYYHENQS